MASSSAAAVIEANASSVLLAPEKIPKGAEGPTNLVGWGVCGGDTGARHLRISATSINRKQSKAVCITMEMALWCAGRSECNVVRVVWPAMHGRLASCSPLWRSS